MILFNILAFVFIFGLIAIIVTVVGFWVRVRSLIDQFRNGSAHNARCSSSRNGSEEVIDQRNPDETDRKIFPKDEGEYVDYTVEDDNDGKCN